MFRGAMFSYRTSPFSRFARWVAHAAGHPLSCPGPCVILGWSITGPTFHFSDAWQLVMNTGATLVPFLMVFLIQNTHNWDTAGCRSSWTN